MGECIYDMVERDKARIVIYGRCSILVGPSLKLLACVGYQKGDPKLPDSNVTLLIPMTIFA